jgi:hypothetical protein
MARGTPPVTSGKSTSACSASTSTTISRGRQQESIYLGQVGGRLKGAFDFFATQVLPHVQET